MPEKKRFKKFVNNVLELHQVSPIEKFSIVSRCAYGSDFNGWVSTAVQKGVQDLYCLVQRDALRLCEFTCQTLTRLKMIGHRYDLKIPLSACLPSLKVLHLELVAFVNDDSVERLFSGCKMLEELTLKDCVSDICVCNTHYQIIISSRLLKILTIEYCYFVEAMFEIDAPNLARLSYKGSTGLKIIPSWKNSCSLAKVELSFCSEAGLEYCSDEFKYDRVLIKAAADKVTELHLMSDTLELLGHEEMPAFRSLSRFYLCNCPFNAWKSVTSLLEKSPQLETGTFHRCSSQSHNGETVARPNEDLTAFSCHAKVIEVHDFYGGEYSLLYLGHLLRNARVLKRLILHRGNISNNTQIKDAMDMLRLLPRASKDCSILLG